MEKKTEINLNKSQAKIHLINANVTHFLGPRATGKTQGGIGPRLLHLSRVMPRSQCVLYSDTFERLESVIVPAITSFLSNEMGIIEDKDFVVFKKPPVNWKKPIVEPRKYDRAISFNSGFVVICGSSHKDGSVNGINAQSAIIDETKFVSKDRIKTQLYKALRGQFKRWGHLPEYRSVWTFSDKYEGDIDWILALRDQQDNRLIQAILTKSIEVMDWKNQLAQMKRSGVSDSTLYRHALKIHEVEFKLNQLRKELVYVCDAEPFENIDILGEKYYRDQKRDCKTEEEYNVAILNQDPGKVEHPYYPNFTEENQYESMDDIEHDKPLIISMDYNWRIISMEVAQISKLPGCNTASLNTVASIHAVEPKAGIPEAVRLFDEMFMMHRKKKVFYVYDSTATAKDAGRKSLKDIVIKELKLRKWSVKPIYIRDLPDQSVRFHHTADWLDGKGIMPVRVNKYRADPLINSINRTGAITSGGKTKKDKRPETDMKIPAENAPHHTEAWDQLLCAVLEKQLIKPMANRGAIMMGK